LDSDYYLSGFSDTFKQIIVHSPTMGAYVALGMALLLLGASAFASASEIAFFSLSPADKSKIEDEEEPADSKVKKLLDDSEYLLATILVTNNFVNVTIIMLLNFFFLKTFEFRSTVVEFIFMTVIVTFLLLLFGEIMPKIYSAQHTLKFVRFAAPTIGTLRKLFFPVSILLVKSSTFINHYNRKNRHSLSVDDLSHALELTDKKEISEENKILQGIIRFGGETAKEVMTSRLDIADLNIRTDFKHVLKSIVDNAYSRIPVWSGTRDNIKGILYIKDLLPHIDKGDSFRWQSLIRPAYFVPETKMIDDLLREFQENRVHIAIVVDEYGGTSGMVTMEDIIEEIVGEIHDEYDDEEQSYVKISDNTYIFEAKTQMSDFYKITQLDDETFDNIEGEADTIGGLLLEIKGEFPKIHEVIRYRNYEFGVLSMDKKRILKVKFTIREDGNSQQKDED
jgi:putative hemolysin